VSFSSIPIERYVSGFNSRALKWGRTRAPPFEVNRGDEVRRLVILVMFTALLVVLVAGLPNATVRSKLTDHVSGPGAQTVRRVEAHPWLSSMGIVSTTSTVAPTTTTLPSTTTTSNPPITTTTSPPTRAPAISKSITGSDATSTDTPDWSCIRLLESGDNYSDYGGGAYQFADGTWQSITGLAGPAEDYAPRTQDAAALRLYNEKGFESWGTRFACGL
jgi:hypothetical protein